MKPRFLCILMVSSFLCGFASAGDVYLAPRTDGKPGSGTSADPYNASSPQKFDALLRRFPSNTAFHYAAGVYTTTGYHFLSGNAGTNCVHLGGGIDKTIIRLVGGGPDSQALIFGVDYNRTCSGFQVTNMTLDCNGANYPTFTSHSGPQPAALNVQGSNILINSVKIIGFGTGQLGRECFPVYSLPGPAFAGQSFSNIHVQNCIFTNPARGNKDGVSVVNLGSGSLSVQVTDDAVINCQFVNLTSDFSYVHAMRAGLCQGNDVEGFITGFYAEPNTAQTEPVTISNNTFNGVFQAVAINFHPTGGYGDLTFSNNKVTMPSFSNVFDAAVMVWNQNSGRPKIKSITVTNNTFQGNPNTGTPYYRAVDLTWYPPSMVVGRLTVSGNHFLTSVPSREEFQLSADQIQQIVFGTNTYSNGGIVPITYTP